MIEVQELLQPIRPESATGDDLNVLVGDETLARLKRLRIEEDETTPVPWPKVESGCLDALRRSSKDLQLAAYLTEAWTRQNGFDGLQHGLALCHGLLDQHWAGLHPGLEDGEIIFAIRAKWLSWMGTSREFLTTVGSVPIAADGKDWTDHLDSLRVDAASIKTDKTEYDHLIASGKPTGEQWRAALANTPAEALAATVASVTGCITTLQDLDRLCAERFTESAPSLRPLLALLEEIAEYLTRFNEPAVDEEPGDQGEPQDSPDTQSAAPRRADGPIAGRAEALRRLKEVAEYFRRAEPHSPIALLVERAVTWGQMPFEELMRDVIQDESTLRQLRDLLGIRSGD